MKLSQLMRSSARRRLDALMRSQASIEFDLAGRILDANPQFLALMGYALDEIRGQHHSKFVEPQYAKSPAYRQFWDDLRTGKPQSAEFMRLTKSGATVWLQASYNPVLDRQGRIKGVIKIAQDTTARKLQDAAFQGQLAAISKSQAVIEFDMSGHILSANDNFLNALGYSIEEVRGQHHSIFVDPKEANSEGYRAFWDELRAGRFALPSFGASTNQVATCGSRPATTPSSTSRVSRCAW